MDARSLGRTGLRVTRLGIGMAALGRPGYMNLGHGVDIGGDTGVEALEGRAHAVLDAAVAAGIGYIDAARSYGRAEAFVASWLASRGIAPGAVTIGTKWGYTYTAGWRVDAERHEVKDHSLATLRRQWNESSDLLGGRVDLLQVHSATLASGILDDRAVHAALAELRTSGAVRALGLTLSGPGQTATLRRAMTLQVDGGTPLFDVVQATWNALEPSSGEALADAHGAGLGVIVKEALANGRLVRGSESDRLRRHADRLGASTDALALAWVLEQPWADVVLLGAATVAQLGSNVAALALTLDDEARRALAHCAEPPARYWSAREAMAWS